MSLGSSIIWDTSGAGIILAIFSYSGWFCFVALGQKQVFDPELSCSLQFSVLREIINCAKFNCFVIL